MKTIVIALSLLLTPTVFAAVEMQSFYFKSNTSVLQNDSQEQLEQLKQLVNEFDIQFIEINGYTEVSVYNTSDKKLAENRIGYISKELNLLDENVTFNAFGNKRIRIDFAPFNWERVDIYYNKEDLPTYLLVKNTSTEDSLEQQAQTIEDSSVEGITRIEEESSYTYNYDLDLHIKFIGDKAKVHPLSSENLEQLADTLLSNPEMTAHIRGHVCCGDNMRISKRRAKTVYKYLVSHGIERKRLSFDGYSNTDPLVYPEETAYDRSLNRRVDVQFNNNEVLSSLGIND